MKTQVVDRHIATLLTKLKSGVQPKKVANYFLTNLGENETLEQASEVAQIPDLPDLMTRLMGKALEEPRFRLDSMQAFRYPHYPFLHGMMKSRDRIGFFFYYPEEAKGLVALTTTKNNMLIARMSEETKS